MQNVLYVLYFVNYTVLYFYTLRYTYFILYEAVVVDARKICKILLLKWFIVRDFLKFLETKTFLLRISHRVTH